tara:strand:+ start:2717 stop:4168 length:1452 start_codon:yes stop_codon:yes gene_type:complete
MSTLLVNTLVPVSGDTITVSGSLLIEGEIILGDSPTDSISFDGKVSSSIVPINSNTFNLGSPTSIWNNVYARNFIGTSSLALNTISSSYALTSSHTNTANIVTVNAQPNITSVGQLTSLQVGAVSATSLSSSGTVIANAFQGDGSSLTNISASVSIITTGVITSSLFISESVRVTHITASGNISASGTVFADNFQSAGGNGTISFTDNLELVGNLSASGNISSSGNIKADSGIVTTLSASGDISSSGNIIADSGIVTTLSASGDISSSGTILGTDIISSGSITASGDISSSGTVSAKFLQITQANGGSDNGAIHFGSTTGDNGFIYDDGNSLLLGYEDTDRLQIGKTSPEVQVTGDLRVFGGSAGNITATGNITADGFVLPINTPANIDSKDFTAHGNKIQMKNQLQSAIVDGSNQTFTIINNKVTEDSVIYGNFIIKSNMMGLSQSIIQCHVDSGSFDMVIHNESGFAISNNTPFTASFVVM